MVSGFLPWIMGIPIIHITKHTNAVMHVCHLSEAHTAAQGPIEIEFMRSIDTLHILHQEYIKVYFITCYLI